MIEAEPKAAGEVGLNLMHFGAVFRDGLACFGGGKLGGCTVFVRGAEEQNLIAACAQVAGVKVGRQLRADEIAQMFDPVDVWDRGCDQNTCHGSSPVGLGAA